MKDSILLFSFFGIFCSAVIFSRREPEGKLVMGFRKASNTTAVQVELKYTIPYESTKHWSDVATMRTESMRVQLSNSLGHQTMGQSGEEWVN